jgi:hypothetical protein
MNDIVELLQFKTFGQDSFPIFISIEIVSSQKAWQMWLSYFVILKRQNWWWIL